MRARVDVPALPVCCARTLQHRRGHARASTGRQRRVAALGPYGTIRSISSKSTSQLRHSSNVHSPVVSG
eukprot:2969659-Prymnesium_polylepis.1